MAVFSEMNTDENQNACFEGCDKSNQKFKCQSFKQSSYVALDAKGRVQEHSKHAKSKVSKVNAVKYIKWRHVAVIPN